jgi:hypothetical protein
MTLAQAVSAPRFCTSSAKAGSPPSIAQLSSILAFRSELVISDRLTSHCTWLLAPPHGQRDGQLVFARHIATGQVGNRPRKALDA